MKKMKVLLMLILMTASFTITGYAASTEEEKGSEPEGYMGFFQVQTSSWVYRNNFDDPNTGYGTEIFDTVYDNESDGPTSTLIEDTLIDGDGVYQVFLKEVDFANSTDFNMVALSTNIPLDAGITVTQSSLKIAGKTVSKEGLQKDDEKNYVHIMFINQYDNNMKDTVNNMVPQPGSEMVIEFTLAGFGYEREVPEAIVEENEVAEVEEEAIPSETEESEDQAQTNEESDNDKADSDNNATNDEKSGLPTPVLIGAMGVIVFFATYFIVSRKK